MFKCNRFRAQFKHFGFAQTIFTLAIFISVFCFALLRCRIAFTTGQYGVKSPMPFLQARQILGGLDAGSYLQGALSLHDSSFRESINQFIWQLWPPGLPIYEAILIYIFGLGGKPLLLLAVTDSLLIAVSASVLWIESVNLRRKKIAIFFLSILLLSSVVQGWLLDQGIMYAEGFFVFLLILAVIHLIRFERTKKFFSFYLSSFLLGLAAYFRAVGFTTIEVIILVAFLIGGFGFALKIWKSPSAGKIVHLAANLLRYGFVAFAVTLPWSLFRLSWTKLNPLQWVITGDLTWKLVWRSDISLQKTGLGITKGVDNWACHLDLMRCKTLSLEMTPHYFAESLRVIVQHPIEFLWMRLTAFWGYWSLNGRWLYPPQNRLPVAFAYLEGAVFLVITIAALILVLTSWRRFPSLSILTLCIFFGTTAPLLVFHLESRYFIPVKILAIVIVTLHPNTTLGIRKMRMFLTARHTSSRKTIKSD